MTPPHVAVLFDIDGTLVRCGPVPRDSLGLAMEEVFGHRGRLADVRFGGKTDLIIVREALPDAPSFHDARWDPFWSRYVVHLAKGLRERPPEVLPGVPELLQALRRRPGLTLHLVTGNTAEGARAKLEAAGLWHFFRADGASAYGSDGESKASLGRIALQRALDRFGDRAGASRYVMVGDTPQDIACARQAGFVAIAVATGFCSRDDLGAARPDALLLSLQPLDEALAAIFQATAPIG